MNELPSKPEHTGQKHAQPSGWSDRDVDLMISNILRSGLVASSVVILCGACVHVIYPHTLAQPDWHSFSGEPAELRTISGIIAASAHGDGRALMQLGILLLLATPFLRVAFAAYAFARQRDATYLVISLVVLAALITGILCGKGG